MAEHSRRSLSLVSPFFIRVKLHCHLHLGTKELQLFLFKVALLLDVDVLFGRYCGLIDPAVSGDDNWKVRTLETDLARKHLMLFNAGVAELPLRPSETYTFRLEQSSKVDFFEEAESLDGGTDQLSDSTQDHFSKLKLYSFDTLLVAEVESSKLIRRLGFDRKVAKYGEAIDIVANLYFPQTHINPTQKKRNWKNLLFGEREVRLHGNKHLSEF